MIIIIIITIKVIKIILYSAGVAATTIVVKENIIQLLFRNICLSLSLFIVSFAAKPIKLLCKSSITIIFESIYDENIPLSKNNLQLVSGSRPTFSAYQSFGPHLNQSNNSDAQFIWRSFPFQFNFLPICCFCLSSEWSHLGLASKVAHK